MRIEGRLRLAIYLGVGAVLAGSGVGIGLSQSTSGHGNPRSAAGVTVPATAATSQASAVSSASPSASAAASPSVVISGGSAGTTAPAPGSAHAAAPPPAPPPCAPVLLDVSPNQVSLGMGSPPAPAVTDLTAECGTITWSARADAGVTLNVYGGTLKAGETVSLVISESSAPDPVSYVFINAGGAAINPGGQMVTVVNPWVPEPPPPCNC